nr:hypothetical protein [Tanacetum cinerariifolium]
SSIPCSPRCAITARPAKPRHADRPGAARWLRAARHRRGGGARWSAVGAGHQRPQRQGPGACRRLPAGGIPQGLSLYGGGAGT